MHSGVSSVLALFARAAETAAADTPSTATPPVRLRLLPRRLHPSSMCLRQFLVHLRQRNCGAGVFMWNGERYQNHGDTDRDICYNSGSWLCVSRDDPCHGSIWGYTNIQCTDCPPSPPPALPPSPPAAPSCSCVNSSAAQSPTATLAYSHGMARGMRLEGSSRALFMPRHWYRHLLHRRLVEL